MKLNLFSANNSHSLAHFRVLSHPSSVSWLDKWLVLVAVSTVFLGCVRALLSGLSSHL